MIHRNAMTRHPYHISEDPVTSARFSPPSQEREIAHLPAHDGKPLLLALARNPTTLFVCWSVDWKTVFADGAPPDRQVHVRLRCNGAEKTIGLEPALGSYSIRDLEPGQTYAVELGYYLAGSWRTIVIGNEAMLPLASEATAPEPVTVATIPFHLSFQRMLDLLGKQQNLTARLGHLQELATAGDLSPTERKILRKLGFSHAAQRRQSDHQARLEKLPIRQNRQPFDFSSASVSSSPR